MNFRTLTLVALATAAGLPLSGAPYPDAPPIPSLAPKAGMTTELFNGVTLAEHPSPGEVVKGWYPIRYPLYNGEDFVPTDAPPSVFDAPAGVLRFAEGFEKSGGYGTVGRARQVPSSTEVCVDLYLDGEFQYGSASFGLNGNLQEMGGSFYGVYVGSYYNFMPVLDEPQEILPIFLEPELVWYVSGNGFYQELEADLSNQWLRLSIKVNKESNTVTYSLNGGVIYTGPVEMYRSAAKDRSEPAIVTPITDVALIYSPGSVGFAATFSAKRPVYSALAFFDNLSHNGAVGTQTDLTAGDKRPSATQVGDGVYSATPGKQVATIEQKFNLPASVWYSLQNDGGSSDEIGLRGTLSGTGQVKIKTYSFAGGRRENVTSSLATGALNVSLEAGKGVVLLSEAKLSGRGKSFLARKRGAVLTRSQTLQSTSTGNPEGGDSLKAVFNFNSAIPLNRPGY